MAQTPQDCLTDAMGSAAPARDGARVTTTRASAPRWLLEEHVRLRLYVKAGWRVREIAKVMGTSPSSVSRACQQLGITGDRRG